MSYTYKYPRPAVTTDCVIFTFHEELLKVLLIRRGIEPFKGMWALPGGFLKMDESAEEGAYRELQEETGVTGCTIKQFHTFSRPDRDPRGRVVTIAFYALMKWQKAEGADDAEFADWIAVNMLPPLAFDHKDIIELALETIRRDIFFEPVGFDLLNDIFSMPEVQKVYEAILGKEFDRRNFAKKMKHLNLLEEVDPEEESKQIAEEEAMPLFLEQQEEKILPLPFLNRPQESKRLSETMFDIGNIFSSPTTECRSESLIFDDMACDVVQEAFQAVEKRSEPVAHRMSPSMQAPKRRKLQWFRLNRKKYDDLKKDDTFEF